MKLFVLLFALFFPQMIRAQAGSITGVVLDSKTHESLAGVSILIFKSSRMSGGITNREGAFSLYEAGETDSIKFSAIGYKSVLLRPAQKKQKKTDTRLRRATDITRTRKWTRLTALLAVLNLLAGWFLLV